MFSQIILPIPSEASNLTFQQALRCHSEQLWTTLESLEEMKPRDLYRLTDEFDSVYFNNNSFLAARLAAGSLISVTDEVLSGRVSIKRYWLTLFTFQV